MQIVHNPEIEQFNLIFLNIEQVQTEEFEKVAKTQIFQVLIQKTAKLDVVPHFPGTTFKFQTIQGFPLLYYLL